VSDILQTISQVGVSCMYQLGIVRWVAVAGGTHSLALQLLFAFWQQSHCRTVINLWGLLYSVLTVTGAATGWVVIKASISTYHSDWWGCMATHIWSYMYSVCVNKQTNTETQS